MKLQRLAVGLILINLAVLLLLAKAWSHGESPGAPTVRTRALELVDERGQVRSRLTVEPDGEVVFRFLDKKGTIRVKLGAGEDGSGLVLLDGATEPAVHLIARRAGTPDRPATTSLTLSGADGRKNIIRP